MAISLSELTGASTSGNVLNEVNSYADFLDSVPRLVNKADPSGATDAVQTVATKQPIALPLIDGEGYLFCSGINGNYAQTPDDDSLDFAGDLVVDVDVTMKSWSPTYNSSFCGKYLSTGDQRSFRFLLRPDKRLQVYFSDDGTAAGLSGVAFSTEVPFSDNQRGQIRFSFNSSNGIAQFFTSTDKGVTWTQLGPDRSTGKTSIHSGTADLYIGAYYTNSELLDNAALHSVKFYDSVTPSSSSLRFNCDFTSPRIPHGASEFLSDSGHQVRVLTSGNNPAKVIKKPVLRFDGSDDGFKGLLNQTTVTDGCYALAAFSVLGDGGETWGRVISFNPTGGDDYQNGGHTFIIKSENTNNLALPTGTKAGMFDDDNGDILVDAGKATNYKKSRVNETSLIFQSSSNTISFDEFNLGASWNGSSSTSIDLEYLAVFPATLSDSQADQIRNFINNRNKVFYRWDTDGYYFFDGAATTDGQVFTGSGSWNGRIVGSDNGDADFYISQNTLDDRPTTDGYKITFADNTDHFDIPSTTQAGWQIVGTSLGTFAYKVDSDAITELNLLGNAAIAVDALTYRKAGDLYGIILLPESATNRDIEEARKLLIDRGASDGASVSSFYAAWYKRRDVVEFRATMPQATDFRYAWKECTSLTSFSTQLPEVTNAQEAWYNNASLSSFTTTDLKNCSNFSGAWQFCTSLTQFPQDAKLGTEATNVNFQSAWQQSGLTSFPALDLSKGNNFTNAWRNCSSLQSFPEDAKLGTEASNVNFAEAWQLSGLTSFSTPLPTANSLYLAWYGCASLTSFSSDLSSATYAGYAWNNCSSLISFSTPLPLSNRFVSAWQGCSSLSEFSADVFANWNPSSITSGIFHNAWDNCSLTTQSVENILVPIANSGKWATSTGLEGGTALTDATIDIDYNVATGSLTAATLTAIETLNGRGWSVNINNEIIVPNILQLQPAAAYSLRSFDADADPTVVNVRRSSDGALSDFTASQVSDGTLEAWVGGSNLITYSNSFSTAWSETSSSTLTGGQAGYDGTNDATEFYDSRSNSAYGMYQQILSLGIDGQITASIYLKAGTVSSGVFDVYYVGGHNVAVSFDLSNGTVEAGRSGGSTNIPDAVGIDNIGNGWYRVSLTNDYGSPDIQYLRVGLSSAGTIFIQDAQVVYGDTVTPYVETNSSPAGNGYVTTWYDQSTNGNDSTQSTASQQPAIVQNGVLVTENGEAALSFDGVNDQLDMGAIGVSGGTARATYAVVSPDSYKSTGGGYLGINTTTLTDGILYDHCVEANQFALRVSGNALYDDSSDKLVQNLWSTNFAGTNAFDIEVFKNSSQITRTGGSDKVLNTLDDWVIAYTPRQGLTYFDGTIQEIVILPSDQSVQRTGIEKNINDHFGIY